MTYTPVERTTLLGYPLVPPSNVDSMVVAQIHAAAEMYASMVSVDPMGNPNDAGWQVMGCVEVDWDTVDSAVVVDYAAKVAIWAWRVKHGG